MMIHANAIHQFVRESNRIEGITLASNSEEEIRQEGAVVVFLGLSKPTLDDLLALLRVFEPTAQLRDKPGMNVRVGGRYPPPGGPDIPMRLEMLLGEIQRKPHPRSPYGGHQVYEKLHPMTDGNGRTGRVLWLWQKVRQGYDGSRGFLHEWYYDSLEDNQ